MNGPQNLEIAQPRIGMGRRTDIRAVSSQGHIQDWETHPNSEGPE